MPLNIALVRAGPRCVAGRRGRARRLRLQSGDRHARPGVPERGRRDQEVQGSAPDAAAAVRRRCTTTSRSRSTSMKSGQRAAKASQRPELQYTFTVLDSEEINAFTTGGGYVYITRGIMNYLNNEAELEAVLGHEIGHVCARHPVRQQSKSTLAGIGAAAVGIFTGSARSRGARELRRRRARQRLRPRPGARSGSARRGVPGEDRLLARATWSTSCAC